MKRDNEMLPLTESRARRLLTEFFDGTTSVEEERQLYGYFRAATDLPDDLRRYALLLGWLDEGMPQQQKRRTPARLFWAFVASTAAMLAIVVTLGFNYAEESADRYAMYEGSYIVRNGHKVTDLRSIMQQLHEAEATADASIRTTHPLAKRITNGAMDPEMRRAVSEILDY